MFKCGLYKIFKAYDMNLAGQEATEKYKGVIQLASSTSANFFADIALCPLETTKVKILTSPAGPFLIPFGAAWAEMSPTRVYTHSLRLSRSSVVSSGAIPSPVPG